LPPSVSGLPPVFERKQGCAQGGEGRGWGWGLGGREERERERKPENGGEGEGRREWVGGWKQEKENASVGERKKRE
jgi:hypothetical protein